MLRAGLCRILGGSLWQPNFHGNGKSLLQPCWVNIDCIPWDWSTKKWQDGYDAGQFALHRLQQHCSALYVNQDIKYANISLLLMMARPLLCWLFLPKKGGIFCVASAKLHIPSSWKFLLFSPFLLGRMKGKDKKSKVHPLLLLSSHHDIYARAHTWHSGITKKDTEDRYLAGLFF